MAVSTQITGIPVQLFEYGLIKGMNGMGGLMDQVVTWAATGWRIIHVHHPIIGTEILLERAVAR